MEKKQFEPCQMEIKSFADVITTSGPFTGLNGEYDLEGNWIPFEGDGQE